MTPEKRIQNDILVFLDSIGIYCWQTYGGAVFDPIKKVYRKPKSRFTRAGVADILGIVSGRVLAIEVKSATGRISPEQRVFIRCIQEAGGIAFVARSVEQVAVELGKHVPEFDATNQVRQ